jgi:hypothetical protein
MGVTFHGNAYTTIVASFLGVWGRILPSKRSRIPEKRGSSRVGKSAKISYLFRNSVGALPPEIASPIRDRITLGNDAIFGVNMHDFRFETPGFFILGGAIGDDDDDISTHAKAGGGTVEEHRAGTGGALRSHR